jgi:molybdenum cofactor biosynthesis enzyme MoaA
VVKKQIILYGAGKTARSLMPALSAKYQPVCFADSDKRKHGTSWCGLPVLSLGEAIEMFPAADFFVATFFQSQAAIIDMLAEKGIPGERIANVASPLEYRWGCLYLERYFSIWVDGISICCGVSASDKLFACTDYWGGLEPSEIYSRVLSERGRLIADMQNADTRPAVCVGCPLLRQGYWSRSDKVLSIALNIESHCNFRCKYCCKDGKLYHGSELDDGAKLRAAMALISYLDSSGRCDEFTQFWIATGEPVISPHFDGLLDIVGYRHITVASNASIFSSRLAAKLQENLCTLRVSIDAGNAATFAAIRGTSAAMFDRVKNNVRQYAGSGNLELQYILLPGENTDSANIDAFACFAKEVGARVVLCHDFYATSQTDIAADAMRMIAELQKQGVDYISRFGGEGAGPDHLWMTRLLSVPGKYSVVTKGGLVPSVSWFPARNR